jgi:hypothetical protein
MDDLESTMISPKTIRELERGEFPVRDGVITVSHLSGTNSVITYWINGRTKYLIRSDSNYLQFHINHFADKKTPRLESAKNFSEILDDSRENHPDFFEWAIWNLP